MMTKNNSITPRMVGLPHDDQICDSCPLPDDVLRHGQPGSRRSLPISEWPMADREAWAQACRREWLKRGGAAAHLAAVTRDDLIRRYGMFLCFLSRIGHLDRKAAAAVQLTPESIDLFVEDLRSRGLSSVTLYGTIHKVRRMAEILNPCLDLAWLREIENDLDFDKIPRAKHGRFLLAEEIALAGLIAIEEAGAAQHLAPLERATRIRNGLIITLMAAWPVRLRAFAAFRIGSTIRRVDDRWWMTLGPEHTKSRLPDERELPEHLVETFDDWINIHQPLFATAEDAMWPSRRRGALSSGQIAKIVCETTRVTAGIEMSPHLFRTAAASSAAIHAGDQPYPGSAILHHRGPRELEKSYERASSAAAAIALREIVVDLET